MALASLMAFYIVVEGTTSLGKLLGSGSNFKVGIMQNLLTSA